MWALTSTQTNTHTHALLDMARWCNPLGLFFFLCFIFFSPPMLGLCCCPIRFQLMLQWWGRMNEQEQELVGVDEQGWHSVEELLYVSHWTTYPAAFTHFVPVLTAVSSICWTAPWSPHATKAGMWGEVRKGPSGKKSAESRSLLDVDGRTERRCSLGQWFQTSLPRDSISSIA